MTLSQVLPTVVAILKEDPILAALQICMVRDAGHNNQVATALRNDGLAIVVIHASARLPNNAVPRPLMTSSVQINILENPAEEPAHDGLFLVERVLATCMDPTKLALHRALGTLKVDTDAVALNDPVRGVLPYTVFLLVESTHLSS